MFEYRETDTPLKALYLVDEERDLEYRIVAAYTHGEFRKGAVLRVGERWVPLMYITDIAQDAATGEEFAVNIILPPLEG